jgi:hypothetical protein
MTSFSTSFFLLQDTHKSQPTEQIGFFSFVERFFTRKMRCETVSKNGKLLFIETGSQNQPSSVFWRIICSNRPKIFMKETTFVSCKILRHPTKAN